MSLKKKDGSDYRLRGPEPEKKDHAPWKKGEYTLHNMKFRETIFNKDLFLGEAAPSLQFAETIPPPDPTPPPKAISPPAKKTPRKGNGVKILIYPMTREVDRDELYNVSREKIVYGNILEELGIIGYQSDLELVVAFLTKYGKGTILMPLNGDRRWWKVETSEGQDGGFFHRCIPSDQSPRFS